MFDNLLTPTHLIVLFVIFLPIPHFWATFKKAGFSPWLGVPMFVPIFNIIILYVVAFSQWKAVPVPPSSVTTHPPQT